MNTQPANTQPATTSKRAALAAFGLVPSKSLPSFAHAKWAREAAGSKRTERARG